MELKICFFCIVYAKKHLFSVIARPLEGAKAQNRDSNILFPIWGHIPSHFLKFEIAYVSLHLAVCDASPG